MEGGGRGEEGERGRGRGEEGERGKGGEKGKGRERERRGERRGTLGGKLADMRLSDLGGDFLT